MSKQMKNSAKSDNIFHHSSSSSSLINLNKKQSKSLFSHDSNFPNLENSDNKHNDILHLQRTTGNQSVQRLIKSGMLQTKLKVSHPSDPYEQEADSVANRIINNDKFLTKPSDSDNDYRSNLAESRKNVNSSPIGNLADKNFVLINSVLQGPGKQIDDQTRNYVEPRLGYNFQNVRIHDDDKASKSAESINALAYTIGDNIVFGKGQYDTSSTEGKKLLAHELMHVIQHTDPSTNPSLIQRQPRVSPIRIIGIENLIVEYLKIKHHDPDLVFDKEPDLARLRKTMGPDSSPYNDRYQDYLNLLESLELQGISVKGLELVINGYGDYFESYTVSLGINMLQQYELELYEQQKRYRDLKLSKEIFENLGLTRARQLYKQAHRISEFRRGSLTDLDRSNIRTLEKWAGMEVERLAGKPAYDKTFGPFEQPIDSPFSVAESQRKKEQEEEIALAKVKHPILSDPTFDWARGVATSSSPVEIQTILLGYIERRIESIKKTRTNLLNDSKLIYTFDILMKTSYKKQNISPDSYYDQIIKDRQFYTKDDIGVLMTILSIAAGIFALATGQFWIAFVVGGASLAANSFRAYEAFKNYKEVEVPAYWAGMTSKHPAPTKAATYFGLALVDAIFLAPSVWKYLSKIFPGLPKPKPSLSAAAVEPPPKVAEPPVAGPKVAEPPVAGPKGAEPPPKGAEPPPKVAEPPVAGPKVAEPPPKVAEPPPKVAEPPPKVAEPKIPVPIRPRKVHWSESERTVKRYLGSNFIEEPVYQDINKAIEQLMKKTQCSRDEALQTLLGRSGQSYDEAVKDGLHIGNRELRTRGRKAGTKGFRELESKEPPSRLPEGLPEGSTSPDFYNPSSDPRIAVEVKNKETVEGIIEGAITGDRKQITGGQGGGRRIAMPSAEHHLYVETRGMDYLLQEGAAIRRGTEGHFKEYFFITDKGMVRF